MEFKLGEVSKFYDSLHKTPKDYNIYGYPMVRVKDISTGFLDLSSCFNVSEDDYLEFSKKYKPQSGDIIITRVGTYGNIALVTDDTKFCLGQNTVILNVDKKMIDNKYLFYYLTSPKGQQQIESRVTGSTQKTISLKSLKEINIIRHDYYKEKQIGNLLYKIDNKINNNRQIVANLEELSQTLFKRWFVDFEFPDENGNPYKSSAGEMVDSELGMIPKGWEIITINDFANNNVITGKTPSTKIKENYSETGIPFLTIPDMHNDIFALNTERYISELDIEKLSKKVLPKNSLSISCIATPGLISIIANDTLTNQQINSFTPNENALYYLYFKLKGMKDYIRDLGSGGSATLNLNKTQFSKIKLVKPINEILYKYDKLVSPNFKMILNIQKEIQQLTQLRDTLLPKLMSGEIEIPDDIEVNEDELSI
ncbi:restriction endonuclease subunit S [Staphylococcus gallinarum]|uniref:restriction endonuclease subunit S n=1 Tax=Staphylococcus gallinarum TaxID=1293 RepID=UPI001E5A36A7|nr:restriction endonuclease subunit S [Staphylococcus gallinarum]MCD8844062.1 restriction endonuclease subunit S [Staphylococcus gallinarum]